MCLEVGGFIVYPQDRPAGPHALRLTENCWSYLVMGGKGWNREAVGM